MVETTEVYTTRVAGAWSTRHQLHKDGEPVGTLRIVRAPNALVLGGEFRPDRGEVWTIRREPGLRRGQFSMWTEAERPEWLCASHRPSNVRREIDLETGGRPYRLLPRPGFRRGWTLYAPKTGHSADFEAGLFGRSGRIAVYRRLDFHILVFAYFLASQVMTESLWPGPTVANALD